MRVCASGSLSVAKPSKRVTRRTLSGAWAQTGTDDIATAPPSMMMSARRLTRPSALRECQSIRPRTPALNQLLHREVPGTRYRVGVSPTDHVDGPAKSPSLVSSSINGRVDTSEVGREE